MANLDLKATLRDPDTVTLFDGAEYPIRLSDEFSTDDLVRLQSRLAVVREFVARTTGAAAPAGNLDPDLARNFDAGVADLLVLVIPSAPRGEIDRLTTGQRLAVIEYWGRCDDARRREIVADPKASPVVNGRSPA